MITLTDKARVEIAAYFADKTLEPLRIYKAVGPTGARLELTLDSPDDEDDASFEVQGFTVCINKNLLAAIGGACIDYTETGLTAVPEIAFPQKFADGCNGSCSGCGNASSCGIAE